MQKQQYPTQNNEFNLGGEKKKFKNKKFKINN